MNKCKRCEKEIMDEESLCHECAEKEKVDTNALQEEVRDEIASTSETKVKKKKPILGVVLALIVVIGGFLVFNLVKGAETPIGMLGNAFVKMGEKEYVESEIIAGFQGETSSPMLDAMLNEMKVKVITKKNGMTEGEGYLDLMIGESSIMSMGAQLDHKKFVIDIPMLLGDVLYYEDENAETPEDLVNGFMNTMNELMGIEPVSESQYDSEKLLEAYNPENYETYKNVDVKKYDALINEKLQSAVEVSEKEDTTIIINEKEEEIKTTRVTLKVDKENINEVMLGVADIIDEVSKDEALKEFIKEYIPAVMAAVYGEELYLNGFDEETFKANVDDIYSEGFNKEDFITSINTEDLSAFPAEVRWDNFLDKKMNLRKSTVSFMVNDETGEMGMGPGAKLTMLMDMNYNYSNKPYELKEIDLTNAINIKELDEQGLYELQMQIQQNLMNFMYNGMSMGME